MTHPPSQAATYWDTAFAIEDADLEYLMNLLLDEETPLTVEEMAAAIIRRRCERDAKARKSQEEGHVPYLPKETYIVGQRIAFPALHYAVGKVTGVRPGRSPEVGEFDVIAVDFSDGNAPGAEDLPPESDPSDARRRRATTREFAARLANHKLNEPTVVQVDTEPRSPDEIFKEYGSKIAAKLDARLRATPDIVRLAGRWFPRALLATISEGHLNIAEAVLDMAGGGPLPTEALLNDIGLPSNINQHLREFSLNYALQEDKRFDEVGPVGEVLWFLRRLEPAEVITTPRHLENASPEYDHSVLTPALVALEKEFEDELTPMIDEVESADEVTFTLLFPHRRQGTLPLSARLISLFPTANVTLRVRFTFVDDDSGEKFPGWVVRPGKYVFGLEDWYKQWDVPVGGQLTVKRSQTPGEVIIKAAKRRPVREWVRTIAATGDNHLTFSMQKRLVGVGYDELMIMGVDNVALADEISAKALHTPFHRLVADVFRELAKLNPQSAVHAKTLYSAVNVARRCAPGAVFAQLVTRPYYAHVGDAYWRFDQSQWTE